MYGGIDGGTPPLSSPFPRPPPTAHRPRYRIASREGNKLFYLKAFKASTLG